MLFDREEPEDEREGIRLSRYGEMLVLGREAPRQVTADEDYYTATNPVPGTAISTAHTSAFDDTAALLAVQNIAQIGGPRLYMDFFMLQVHTTAVTASPTTMQFSVRLDSSQRIVGGTPAGAVSLIGSSVNIDNPEQSNALVVYGIGTGLLLPSSASSRQVARCAAPNNKPLDGDEIEIQFGRQDQRFTGTRGNTAAKAAQQACISVTPPFVIGPQQWMTLHMWWPGVTSPIDYEFNLGWWER